MFNCFAGCGTQQILDAIDLDWNLIPQADPKTGFHILDSMGSGYAALQSSQIIEAATQINSGDVCSVELENLHLNSTSKAKNLRELTYQYIFIIDSGHYYNRITGYACTHQAFNTAYASLNLRDKSGRAIKPTTAMERSDEFVVADGRGWMPQPDEKELPLINESGAMLANLWRGFAITSKEGSVQPWTDLAEHLIPDEQERSHFIDRVAFDIQFPHEKPNWHIVFIGVHGAGKEAILTPLCRIFGEAATTIGNNEAKSDFDDGFAKTKVVVYSEVQGLSGDAMEEMKRKATTGASEMYTLNPKGEKKIRQRNLWSLYLVTNNQDAMKLEQTERRFYVLECKSPMTSDQIRAYFNDWLNKQGSQHLFDWLLKRDLSKFNPNQIPGRTAAFYKMISATRSDYHVLLEECMAEGCFSFKDGFVDEKQLRTHLSANGASSKLTTVSNWLMQQGYAKYQGQVRKKENGQTLTLPRSIYYTQELLDKSVSELYDYVRESRKGAQNDSTLFNK